MFGRRGKQTEDDLDDDLEGDLDDGTELEDEPAGDDGAVDTPPGAPAVVPRPRGPWDVEDMPRDDVERVDLGGLLVPVSGGHELRVDVDPTTSAIVSITLGTPTSVMQVAGFAAPRTGGIWQEVRDEIATSLLTDGGGSEEEEGPYGRELRATLPVDESGQHPKARFLGVDGPRWFVRAMLQGLAAADLDAEPELLAAFGQIVVVRGVDAMAVRDALPLRLPPDVAGPAAEAAALAAAGGDAATAAEPAPGAEAAPERTYELPDRGPLNTETR